MKFNGEIQISMPMAPTYEVKLYRYCSMLGRFVLNIKFVDEFWWLHLNLGGIGG